MFRSQQRFNSTAQLVQAQLAQRLEAYFQNTRFKFAKPQHVDELRRVMELVYLRKRPLVAVDVEAYEKKPRLVTELGFAIYDPENQWLSAVPHVKTVHIISQENKKYLNHSFVPNNKYKFNGGTSHQMSKKASSRYLKDTFKYYFEDRNAVLIGHHLQGDIKWLQGHGVANIQETPQVDTQRLFHLSRRKGATLRGILQRVDIPHANLHNAANDAYYTLLAAMSYCDPEKRSHYDLDSYVDTEVPTEKETKLPMRREKFNEKAFVSMKEPPSMEYKFPVVTKGQGQAWVEKKG